MSEFSFNHRGGSWKVTQRSFLSRPRKIKDDIVTAMVICCCLTTWRMNKLCDVTLQGSLCSITVCKKKNLQRNQQYAIERFGLFPGGDWGSSPVTALWLPAAFCSYSLKDSYRDISLSFDVSSWNPELHLSATLSCHPLVPNALTCQPSLSLSLRPTHLYLPVTSKACICYVANILRAIL